MITFGIPKRRIERKEELFPDTPVITMKAWEGKGFNKKFEFNSKALDLLDINLGMDSVNFAFNDDLAFIAKQNGEDAIVVAKNRTISNKGFYDYISNMYRLDNSKDNYMELVNPIQIGDITAYMLREISTSTVENSNTPETIGEMEESFELHEQLI